MSVPGAVLWTVSPHNSQHCLSTTIEQGMEATQATCVPWSSLCLGLVSRHLGAFLN